MAPQYDIRGAFSGYSGGKAKIEQDEFSSTYGYGKTETEDDGKASAHSHGEGDANSGVKTECTSVKDYKHCCGGYGGYVPKHCPYGKCPEPK